MCFDQSKRNQQFQFISSFFLDRIRRCCRRHCRNQFINDLLIWQICLCSSSFFIIPSSNDLIHTIRIASVHFMSMKLTIARSFLNYFVYQNYFKLSLYCLLTYIAIMRSIVIWFSTQLTELGVFLLHVSTTLILFFSLLRLHVRYRLFVNQFSNQSPKVE